MSCGDPTITLSINKQKLKNGPSYSGPGTEGSTDYVICQIGFSWFDGISSKNISCKSTGIWEIPSACACNTPYALFINL